MKMIGDCRPVRTPEQVDAVDQDGGLVLADVGGGEGLPDAVRLGDRVGVHHDDVEAIAMAPDAHRLVEIRQPHDDGAARSACANDQDTDCAMAQQIGRQSVLDAHATPSLRARTAPASAATGSASRAETVCVCPPGRSKAPRTLLGGGSGGRHWRE